MLARVRAMRIHVLVCMCPPSRAYVSTLASVCVNLRVCAVRAPRECRCVAVLGWGAYYCPGFTLVPSVFLDRLRTVGRVAGDGGGRPGARLSWTLRAGARA